MAEDYSFLNTYVASNALIGFWDGHRTSQGRLQDYVGTVHGEYRGQAVPHIQADGTLAIVNHGTSGWDRVRLGSINALDPLAMAGSTNFTVGARLEQNGRVANFQRILDKSVGGFGSGGYSLVLQNNAGATTADWGAAFYMAGNSSVQMMVSTPLDTQFYVFATVDGTTIRWYYVTAPGVPVLVKTETNSNLEAVPVTTSDMAIGSWNHSATNRALDGIVDFALVANSTWDLATIQAFVASYEARGAPDPATVAVDLTAPRTTVQSAEVSHTDNPVVTLTPQTNQVELVTAPDNRYLMWMARLTGLSPGSSNVFVEIGDTASQHQYPESSLRAIWSYDRTDPGVGWSEFDNFRYVDTGANSRLVMWNNLPFAQSEIYVAFDEPWGKTENDRWLLGPNSNDGVLSGAFVTPLVGDVDQDYIVATSGLQASINGRTIDNAAVYGFEIKDPSRVRDDDVPKTVNVFTTGAHASEDIANFAMQGLVEWILGSTPEAERYRAFYDTVIVPYTNVPGRELGHWKGQFDPASPLQDMNQHLFLGDAVPLLADIGTALIAAVDGRTVSATADFHGSRPVNVANKFSFFEPQAGADREWIDQIRVLATGAGETIDDAGEYTAASNSRAMATQFGATYSHVPECYYGPLVTVAEARTFGEWHGIALQTAAISGPAGVKRVAAPVTGSMQLAIESPSATAGATSQPADGSLQLVNTPPVGSMGVTGQPADGSLQLVLTPGSATAGMTGEPADGSLQLSAATVTVSVGATGQPADGALTLTLTPPSATAGATGQPADGALVLSAGPITASVGAIADPADGSLQLTDAGVVASVESVTAVPADTTLQLTLEQPTATVGGLLAVVLDDTLTLTAEQPTATVSGTIAVQPADGQLQLTRSAITVSAGDPIVIPAGNFVLCIPVKRGG